MSANDGSRKIQTLQLMMLTAKTQNVGDCYKYNVLFANTSNILLFLGRVQMWIIWKSRSPKLRGFFICMALDYFLLLQRLRQPNELIKITPLGSRLSPLRGFLLKKTNHEREIRFYLQVSRESD